MKSARRRDRAMPGCRAPTPKRSAAALAAAARRARWCSSSCSALLIYNSISVMDEKLTERTRIHLEEQKQLLSAALAVAARAGDRAQGAGSARARARASRASRTSCCSTARASVIAASGWDKRSRCRRVKSCSQRPRRDDVFHTEVEVRIGGERYGKLALGLSTRVPEDRAHASSFATTSRSASSLLILSTGLMVALAYWLTRNLTKLSAASAQLAAGDLNVQAAGARRRRSRAAHARVQHHGRGARRPHQGARRERGEVHRDRRLQL